MGIAHCGEGMLGSSVVINQGSGGDEAWAWLFLGVGIGWGSFGFVADAAEASGAEALGCWVS